MAAVQVALWWRSASETTKNRCYPPRHRVLRDQCWQGDTLLRMADSTDSVRYRLGLLSERRLMLRLVLADAVSFDEILETLAGFRARLENALEFTADHPFFVAAPKRLEEYRAEDMALRWARFHEKQHADTFHHLVTSDFTSRAVEREAATRQSLRYGIAIRTLGNWSLLPLVETSSPNPLTIVGDPHAAHVEVPDVSLRRAPMFYVDFGLGTAPEMPSLSEIMPAATPRKTASVEADALGELFAQELKLLLGDQAALVDEEAVRRGARAAAAEMAWARRLRTHLLNATDVALLLNVSLERIDVMIDRVELVALWRGDEPSFPAWQFASKIGDTERAVLAQSHALYVTASGASPWSAASWLIEDHPELDGVSPVAWARMGADTETLFQVARRDAARAAL
jgi:hypothetical protein